MTAQDIADLLKATAARHNTSQIDMARRNGVSQATMCLWMRGENLSHQVRLLNVLEAEGWVLVHRAGSAK
ncbi:hypothetical protein DRQ53_12010 [bacterium]|nr:MAG: hypothetical protein DRQ53_12010 [bacterium]